MRPRTGIVLQPRCVSRVAFIAHAEQFSDLYTFAFLRLHPLKGEREGQHSITLVGRWRLILTTPNDTTVVVEEVSNHYGD